MKDLALTTAGMPAVVLEGTRYPMLFSIGAIKEWADHQGVSFQEAVEGGFDGPKLSFEDTAVLLGVTLRAGERRRVVFEGGSAREIGDDIVAKMLDLLHPREVWTALVTAWDYAPREPDPPKAPESPLPGGESSD